MSRQKRVIMSFIVLELLLAGLWFYLNTMALTSPSATPESAGVIGQAMGTVIGASIGLFVILFLMARKNDRARGDR